MEIKPGDLVMCVKPRICDGNEKALGLTFVAGAFAQAPCWCGSNHGLAVNHPDGKGGIGLYRLKRIPPLGELESEQRKEELHA